MTAVDIQSASHLDFQMDFPERFFNYDRLIQAMEARNIDGLLILTKPNVFYTTGFKSIANLADESPAAAFIFSRHQPDHPILVLMELDFSHFATKKTWVRDIRAYRTIVSPLDIPVGKDNIDRFTPESARNHDWARTRYEHYALGGQQEAVQKAMNDVGLSKGTVACDALSFGSAYTPPGVDLQDGYGLMMHVREVKTPAELELLKKAQWLNEVAIVRTTQTWSEGMTWRELNINYNIEVARLGGVVGEPGGVGVANPANGDTVFHFNVGNEDFELDRGQQIIFDCHGTVHNYSWDGGKPWTIGDEPGAPAKKILDATAKSLIAMSEDVRPGMSTRQLQAIGREVFRKEGVADPDSAIIFFHGLGLSHADQEAAQGPEEDAREDEGWKFQENMVFATHVFYPGDKYTRMFWEDICVVKKDGSEKMFEWDYVPLVG